MQYQKQILKNRSVIFINRVTAFKETVNGYIDITDESQLKVVLEYDNGALVAFDIDSLERDEATFFDSACTQVLNDYHSYIITKMAKAEALNTFEYLFVHQELSRQAK